MMWQVWMLAEHGMCDSIFGGHLFGVVEAETWEDACIAVMSEHGGLYWDPDWPTEYGDANLCKSWEEALISISEERQFGMAEICWQQLREAGHE